MRKAVLGDVQNIGIDFDGAKAGEVYHVQVVIEKPDGTIEARYIDYKFYEPISKFERKKAE